MTTKYQKSANTPLTLILREFVINKTYAIIFLISSFFCVLIYFIKYDKQDLTLIPGSIKDNVYVFTDKVDKGESIIQKVSTNESSFEITYVLQEGFLFPYVGMDITMPGNKYFPLEGYNKMELTAASENLHQILIYLNVKDPNVKDTLNRLAPRRLGGDMVLGTQPVSRSINLMDLTTPDWWYSKIHQPKSDFTKPDLNKVTSIIFSTGVNPRINQKGVLKIYSVRFYRDNFWVIISMLATILLQLVGMFIVFYQKKKKAVPAVPVKLDIRYKATSHDEPVKSKSGYSFLDYIHEQYINPELNLKEISRAVGINERAISDTIAEKFGCNFKTYINQIRIAESKRLLLSTDLKVSEIAYKVGFNSPVNFNRVFKTITGENPSEFVRKNEKHNGVKEVF